ncbi:MAG: sugar-binding protein [Bacteroidota bacterium]
MKKKLTFLFVLGLTLICLPGSYAQLITVDGTAESAWDAAAWRPVSKVLQGADNITDQDDFSANHKIMWDAQGVYVLAKILDETLTNDQAQYFNNDMVEIYFDMDNSKNILKPGASWNVTAYDENDYQFKLSIGDDAVAGGPAGADVSFASNLTVEGEYMLEFFFDWADLGLANPLAQGDKIGFDITVGDNDDTTSRQSYLGWNTPSGEAYHDPSLFGTLILDANNLTTVPTGIIVDGRPDPAWYSVPTYSIGKEIMGTAGGDDLSGNFKVYYDTEGIYVWAVVLDDTLTTQGSNQYFNNDFMEVYFDMDNSKIPLPEGSWWNVSSYDDNDYQYKFIFSQDTIYGGPNRLYSIEQYIDTGSFYAVEMLFPWDSLGYTLTQGDTLGFDIVVGDNDSTNARQRMISWNTIDGEAYHDASRFGTLVLAENGKMVKPEGITIDGKKDPIWSEIEKMPINTILSGEATITNPLDFSGYHQLYWDEDAFYLLIQVNDDTLTTTQELEYWQVDNIEVYWDMDNSKNPCPGCAWNVSSYDENDFQYQLRIGDENLNHYAEFSQNIFNGGYLVEYKFPIDSMNIDTTYQVGDLIGFDIYVTDNDNNTTRDAQLSWFDDSGEAYHIASKFGTIELLENGKVAASNECEIIPPTVPEDLSSENGTSSFTIFWSASEDNIAVTGYEVYRKSGSDNVLVGTVIDNSIEIFDFESEGQYEYVIRAYDECGNFSGYSEVITVTAPKVLKYNVVQSPNAIVLDGKADEDIWANAVWDTSSIYKLDPTNTTEDSIPEAQDLQTIFAMAWDTDYLYVFIDVSDANVVNWDGTSNDWPTRNVPYQFDCIELCIAGSNERYISDAGLKAGDSQWRLNTGVSGTITGNPGTADLNSYNVEFAEGISLRHAGGYTFEIKFPWSAVFRDITIPANLGVGTEMLFTLITIDNDGRKDGDMFLRDHELAYFDGTGNHWKQTNGYKAMVLGELPSSVKNFINSKAISVYPNPASDKLFINSGLTFNKVSILNITGQLVKVVDLNNNDKSISIADLPEGVYTVICETDNESYLSKFIKK